MVEFNSKIIENHDALSNNDNQNWWQNNPMIYDWELKHGEIRHEEEYYKIIDDIFGYGHSLINNPDWPKGKILEKFIPYNKFNNKNVLEIGCGAGLVSSHIANSNAILTSIDLTHNAVELTKKRFSLCDLSGDIRQMDAESLKFEDNSFDYVVSWGVIHHSGNMIRILDEIYRVLKPEGKAFIMVYNKNSIRYQVYARFWLGIVKLKYFNMSLAEIVGSITDGYIARHLSKNDTLQLTKKFSDTEITYSDEKTTILKYLFGVGKIFAPIYLLTRPFERFLAKRWGWYLEMVLTK